VSRETLARPFDPRVVRHRAGARGATVAYVDVATVIERLNADLPSWSYEVVSHEVYDDEVVVLGRLTADGVVKMAFGTAELTRDRDGNLPSKGDALKAASSDGLKKAASLLGVGLEFSRKEAAPPEQHATPTRTPRDLARRPEPAAGATPRQVAALETACARKGWTRDSLTALVGERYAKKNAGQLSRSEASTLISELTGTNGH
jgi:hypothetical protein